MVNEYFLYVTLAITITVIPGPAVILTIKNSIRHGFQRSLAGVLGNFCAMIIMATISALGLGAVLLASSTLFTLVKLAGGLYLVYLGVKAWRGPHPAYDSLGQTAPQDRKDLISVFKDGFWVGMSNPKAIAFFTALFPHFIDAGRAFVPQFLTLILTVEGISFCVLVAYAFVSSKAARYLCREHPMRLFHKLTGGSFVGFGVALIYEK